MSAILIRHVEPTDAQALQRLYAHPQTYGDTLQLPFPPEALWAKRIAELPGSNMHSLVACIDGQVVGQLTLKPEQSMRRRHVATFGVGVDPQFQGCGVGSSLMAAMLELCDGWLNIQRIELTVFTDNPAALALYRKFGFEIEGTSRRYAFRAGAYVDVHHMARLRE